MVLSGSEGTLVLEEPTLDVFTKGEACERSVAPDYPMTRDDQANGIGRVGAPDRARSIGLAELRGQTAIAHRLAKRNTAERVPDLVLKRRSDRGQRHRELTPFADEVLGDFATDVSGSSGIVNDLIGRESLAKFSQPAERRGDHG